MPVDSKLPTPPDSKKLVLGLFGFGVVGKGLYEVLKSTPGLNATIKKICIKDPGKLRSIPAENFTTDPLSILNDPEINVVVELIDDAFAAFEIVSQSLRNGKAVVSANKKMIAGNFEKLLALQFEYAVPLLYEGSCCASIPIIRNLEEYYDNDLLSSIKGIVNGSTNYILTKISEQGLTFRDALLQAQQLGFAESNPKLDIEGEDAANKLAILLAHAFGAITDTEAIIYAGITSLKPGDTEVAKQKGLTIKLVATAKKLKNGKIAAFVLPQFVSGKDELANVNDEFNGLITESSFSDKHFFKGKGAGAFPTAAAVLSDIAALRYNYKYEYKKYLQQPSAEITTDFYLKLFVSATDMQDIKKEEFEWIEEWHSDQHNNWVIGVIHATKLQENKWWKENGVSLILTEDAIIEDIEYRHIGRKSLLLAGVV